MSSGHLLETSPIQAIDSPNFNRRQIGYVVVADGDGAVLIPAALLDEVAKLAPEQERFEAWVQNNRGNHFTVTETWKSIAGVDTHIVAPVMREFRDKLGTMTGALYDERLYTSIE